MKIEKFLGILYSDLNETYRVENEELEKIRRSIQAFESGGELSAMDQASYLAAKSMERGCSGYCNRIKNALDSIELLIKPQTSISAYVRDLLEQYYRESKKAAYISGEVDTKNVVSVQISQLEGRMREVGYAIIGGPETLLKIEKKKNQKKVRKAEKKLKKAQEAQRRLKGSAAEEDHADEMNCADPVQEKVINSDVQAGDAKEDPANPTAAEDHTDEINYADPVQEKVVDSDVQAGDAKEDPADSAAAENNADETNCADPTAQTGDTPADAKEKPEEETIPLVIRLIVFR